MDGIIVINKEKGYTSNDVVQIVKRIFNKKVGHTGTLDPMATGVLPLLIGQGTLLSKYLINHDKTYQATLTLGKKMDTGDSEGNVVEEKEVLHEMLTEENLNNTLKSFIGEQTQIPPIYSAIKVKGKKLYEYARNEQEVEIPKRNIIIYDMKLINFDTENAEIKFEVSCSKGTYIRTLCEDIAKKINTVGYMSDLLRTRVGSFDIQNSVTIKELKEENNINIISIEQFFKDKENIILDENKLKHFYNGVKITTSKQEGIYKIYNIKNEFIGIGVIKNELLKRDIILNNF